MDDVLFHQRITEIVRAIKDAGYDPYDQLMGYLKTGEDYYAYGGSHRQLVRS